MKIRLENLPPRLENGIKEIESELPFSFSDDGIRVKVKYGDVLSVSVTEDGGEITVSKDVELFRALCHIAREGLPCFITEKASFETDGIMLDESRGAVHKPETVKKLLRKMALMGLNSFMLYTEDTYEVEGYPYFGYLRGRFTKSELKELDDCAYSLGIEMFPCIQTLGHCHKILKWQMGMGYLGQSAGTLFCGEEETYKFIESIMKDASEPYRSKRIHIGMDEAGDIGRGKYQQKHGVRPQPEVFSEHLARVKEIADKLGLRPMIWSDMYFTMASGTGDYDPACPIPDEVKKIIPSGVDLVYWDYYHGKYDFYKGVIENHLELGNPTVFAGGMWSWGSPAPNSIHTLDTTLPALKACRDAGVKEVFNTCWGDCGAEANIASFLYGLMLYAEIDYTGRYDEKEFGRRFESLFGANPDAYLALGRFNMIPGARREDDLPANSSFFLLWEDPVAMYFEKDLEGLPVAEHFTALAKDMKKYHLTAKGEEQKRLWLFYRLLAEVLRDKAILRESLPGAIRRDDTERVKALYPTAKALDRNIKKLRSCWDELWHDTNTDFGWLGIDVRVGALSARAGTLCGIIAKYLGGDKKAADVIREEKLPFTLELGYWARLNCGNEYRPTHFGDWVLCASAGEVTF